MNILNRMKLWHAIKIIPHLQIMKRYGTDSSEPSRVLLNHRCVGRDFRLTGADVQVVWEINSRREEGL
jgi:hypothetical protein